MTRTRSAIGRGSREKGRAWEQEVARRLRDWLGPEWTVSRVPTERQRGQVVAEEAGDLHVSGPHPWPFAIECKATESWDHAMLFSSPVAERFAVYWRQAREQAGERIPLLFAKRNRAEPVVLLPADAAQTLPRLPAVMRIDLCGESVAVIPAWAWWGLDGWRALRSVAAEVAA